MGRRGFPSGGNFRTSAAAVRADRAQERCCWGDRPAGARDPPGPGKTSTGVGETGVAERASGRKQLEKEAAPTPVFLLESPTDGGAWRVTAHESESDATEVTGTSTGW